MSRQSQQQTFEYQHELLASVNDMHATIPTFEACLDAHGMYETMRFVLRLSPLNHDLMNMIEEETFEPGNAQPEVMQAFSTYLHETVHWWQHVGSTSGLLFSLSYLAQCHSSMAQLREVINTIGAKKSLKRYTDQTLQNEGHAAQTKLASANIAVNNALDVEYYKYYAYSPRKNIKWMIKEKHFESVGHCYFIVYGQLVGMLADTIDPDYAALPQAEKWDTEMIRLNQEQVEGFYNGSPVQLPAVGIQAIYEGQAHFVQLQFLDSLQDKPMLCADWKRNGYLFGIYVEAFETFLKLSESEWPEHLDDPLVALFLLLCDLSINPTRGIPLEIENFETFILDVDVGVRFTRLCFAVKELPHLKKAIKSFSKNEYITVSRELTEITGYDHPTKGLESVIGWIDKAPELTKLLEEYRTFEYDKINLPIRVFLSHFVAFCQDKIEHPEFFCWPAVYLAGKRNKAQSREIWLRHLSLFSDRGDKDGVYPRKWPNRSEEAVMNTFNNFYGSMALYDLTRQWILKDGPFECDFQWLSENYNQAEADAWGNSSFKQIYGVTLDKFEIL